MPRLSLPHLRFINVLRLRHVILASVLFSVLVAELVVIGIAYIVWSQDQFRRLDEETLLMLKANVDMTSFPTVDQTVKMGQRLVSFSPVKGGAIYNQLNEQIAAFGQRPASSLTTFQREGYRHRLNEDETFLDVFYPVEMTGFANPVVLRIDASRVPAILKQQLQEKATITFIVAFISSIVVVFLLSITIVAPMLKLRDAVLAATDNPDKADQLRMNWKRADEFGEVSRALDLLFTTVSIVHQEDLAAGQEATQRSAFAVLTYDINGSLMNSNEAALQLFGVGSQNELSRMSDAYVRLMTDEGTRDVSPISMLSDGDVVKTTNIVTARGLKRCMMNAVTVHKRNGAVLRHIVTLIDVTHQSQQNETLKGQVSQMSEDSIELRRRLAQMRSLFKSSMVLLSHQKEQAEASSAPAGEQDMLTATQRMSDKPIVLTERIVSAWYADAIAAHLVEGEFQHSALIPVRGTPDQIETIFSQAFMLVYSRSPARRAKIAVKSEPAENGQARFEIWEVNDGAGAVSDPVDKSGEALSLASLHCSLRSLGGQLMPMTGGGNMICFELVRASFNEAHAYHHASSRQPVPQLESSVTKAG